jgi:hypothetical protein
MINFYTLISGTHKIHNGKFVTDKTKLKRMVEQNRTIHSVMTSSAISKTVSVFNTRSGK